ncbi:hypothetical protein K491DRAFT_515158 [Lophiostoma macrostomum CBS 122681]|uniref:Uncharacterized protein n=1 Tax=Lophiostoma macrostomum CBS 122681 TaxID=1314788 RepID=A0A6A6T3Q1_9PLEO|nr:hypothetical protein K491DRAFT_515158 [Lophiostoma macrostomum CBS 122681]
MKTPAGRSAPYSVSGDVYRIYLYAYSPRATLAAQRLLCCTVWRRDGLWGSVRRDRRCGSLPVGGRWQDRPLPVPDQAGLKPQKKLLEGGAESSNGARASALATLLQPHWRAVAALDAAVHRLELCVSRRAALRLVHEQQQLLCPSRARSPRQGPSLKPRCYRLFLEPWPAALHSNP